MQRRNDAPMRRMVVFLRYAIDGRQVKRLILLAQAFALSMLIGCRAQMGTDMERYQAREDALIAAHAAELDAVISKAEAGIYASQYLPDSAQGDVLPLARWLGCLEGLYPGLSSEAKALACWVVFNRVDSPLYPDDMEWVLLQEGQFAEYDPEKTATEENYSIAVNQISRWKNGDIRPCGEDAVFITVSSDGVELRDEWGENARCNRWVA